MKKTIQLVYGAKIKPDGKGYLVTFRDIKNAFTDGETYEEAIFNAREVLDLMLLDRIEKSDHIPEPSRLRKNEVPIMPSPDVSAPVLLHLLRKDTHFSLAEVAKAMHVPYQSYQRMESSGKNLTMKSIKRAAQAMGAIVEIRLHPIETLMDTL
ncbi:MAG TPA: type II toxin-antitoxin system HicB family antitoxin [Gammaproteobacteria bacterium]|nr:type II toxin-antitoxin system HicB family antitoxin [Gammaproteobacteria bacterium]